MIFNIEKLDGCDIKVKEMVQAIDLEVNTKLAITSGYRNEEHNRRVGGASNSSHPKGLAVDFQAQNYHVIKLANWALLNSVNFGICGIGINLYLNYIHIDLDQEKREKNVVL